MTQAPTDLQLPDTSPYDPQTVLRAAFGAAVAAGLGVAVWRLPQTETLHLLISLHPTTRLQLPVLETAPPGFMFHPFQVSEQQPLHYLTADLCYATSGKQIQFNPEVGRNVSFKKSLGHFSALLQERLTGSSPTRWHPGPTSAAPTGEGSQYTAMVEAAVRQIDAEEMEKVVLSRSRAVPLPENFDLLAVLAGLSQTYPQAFVYLVSVPDSGTWLGASPETLVHLDAHQLFRTEALAGTQPYPPGSAASEAIWRQKEIEEQSLVVRYIINCFKKIRLREYVETGPKTVIAGNLMHLKTEFRVDLKAVEGFPDLTSRMMHLLHPTSAICGMPMEKALSFISANEGYDRAYYSGFMGPVGLNQETRLFVTLRCTQVTDQALILYAGAGVTGESVPEKEWQETEMKMETMLSVIRKYT